MLQDTVRDALLGGFLAALRRNGEPSAMLRETVSCGAASVLTPGAEMFSLREVRRIRKQVRVRKLK